MIMSMKSSLAFPDSEVSRLGSFRLVSPSGRHGSSHYGSQSFILKVVSPLLVEGGRKGLNVSQLWMLHDNHTRSHHHVRLGKGWLQFQVYVCIVNEWEDLSLELWERHPCADPKYNMGPVVASGVGGGVLALLAPGRHVEITGDGWSILLGGDADIWQGHNLLGQHHKCLVVVKSPVVLGGLGMWLGCTGWDVLQQVGPSPWQCPLGHQPLAPGPGPWQSQ